MIAINSPRTLPHAAFRPDLLNKSQGAIHRKTVPQRARERESARANEDRRAVAMPKPPRDDNEGM